MRINENRLINQHHKLPHVSVLLYNAYMTIALMVTKLNINQSLLTTNLIDKNINHITITILE